MSVGGRVRAGQGPARASIVDVAERAGVSVATVSRALRALPNVSATTAERVRRAALELDYIASPLAAGLVTGRVRSVGVITPTSGRWFCAEVVRGIEGVLAQHGYDLVLHVLPPPGQRARFFAESPLRRRVDAVVVAALPLAEGELQCLRSLGLPLACVGETLAGAHGERIDDRSAARAGVQHLINLGHRRIATIGGPDRGHLDAPGLRRDGFETALAAHGLPVRDEWCLDGNWTPRGGERAMTELLSAAGGRPTAVFCQSDEMAFGALRALRRAGLRCPEEVSVLGFDDHELAETFDLTTVHQPVAALGAAAAEWVIGTLEDCEAARPGVVRHRTRLVLRGSTGPARGTGCPA